MSMKFKNNSGSKLANDILATATGFTVLAGTGSNFPELTSNKDYFHVTLVGDDGDMEIVRVTKVEGDVLTCIRAQEDTVAKDWPAGTRVENRITAEFLNMAVIGGDGGVHYIDTQTSIDDIKDTGIYVTRDSSINDCPSYVAVNSDRTSLSIKKENYATGVIVIVQKPYGQPYQYVYTPHGQIFTREWSSSKNAWNTWSLRTRVASTTVNIQPGLAAADNTTLKAFNSVLTVLPSGFAATTSSVGTVKPDNTTTVVSSDGTISVNPSGLIGNSGPDNYLEVVDDKLVVRGVQTSTNQILMGQGTSITRSSVLVNNTTLALIKINDFVYPTHAFPANNANIAAIRTAGSGSTECTVFNLKPGTYHFSAEAHNTTKNGSLIHLFKREGPSWVTASIGSYTGEGAQIESAHFDAHFTITEDTDFAIGLGVGTWNLIEVSIQKFADASLLAPALMQSKGGAFSGSFADVGNGTYQMNEHAAWKSIAFSDIVHSSVDSTDDIVELVKMTASDSKFDAFSVKKAGLYHAYMNLIQQNPSNTMQSGNGGVALFKAATGELVTIELLTGILYGENGQAYMTLHAHVHADIGDKFVFFNTPTTGTLLHAAVFIQLFPDTLSHPNHGISQDAGNMAQVGSDLGVYVPDISGVNTGEIYSEDLGQVSLINSSTSDQIQFSNVTQGTDMTHPNLFSMSASSSDADTYTDFVCNADGTYHLKCTIPLTNSDTQYSQYFKSYIKVTRNGSPIQVFVTDEYLWSSSTKYFDLCGIVNLKIGDVITLHTYAQNPSTMSLSTAEVVFCRIASLAPDVSDLDIEIPTATTTTTGITRLATNAQAVAGTESGAYVLTPATGKANAISSVINELSNEESNLYTTITNVAGDIVSDAVTNSTSDIYNSINQVVEASNAGTATKLKTARTISLTGNATGSATFDGSANAAIAVTVSQASNAGTWGGSTKYVSTAAASGGAAGDIWFQYV